MKPLTARLPAMRRAALGLGPAPTYRARRVFPRALLEDAARFDHAREAWVKAYVDAVKQLVPLERSRLLVSSIDPWGHPVVPGEWWHAVILTIEVEPPPAVAQTG